MTSERTIRLLSWLNAAYNFRLYSAIAVIYFAQVTGSYALALAVFSAAHLSGALLEIPTGLLSDRFGRVATLRLGAAANALAVGLYAIAGSAGGFGLLTAGGVLEGAGRALFSGNNDALLYEALAADGRREGYAPALGRVYAALEIAGFLAVVAGSLVASWSFALLMWLSVVPQVAAVGLSMRIPEPPRADRPVAGVRARLSGLAALFRDRRRLRAIGLARVWGAGLGEVTWSVQAAFYGSLLPLWAVGPVLSLNFLQSAVGYRLSGRVLRRLPAVRLLAVQEVWSRGLDIAALAWPTPASPLLMAAAGALYGPGEVAASTLVQAEIPDHSRATGASALALGGSLLFAAAAPLVGLLADSVGLAPALLLVQIGLLPGLGLYLYAGRLEPGDPDPGD